MSILERAKQAAQVLFRPQGGSYAGSNKAVLDQLFSEKQVELLRGSWHPRCSPGTGARVQWEHTCQCGQAYTLLESEVYRRYTCGGCKKVFDFMAETGVRLTKNKEMRAAMLRKLAQYGFVETDWSMHDSDGDYLPEPKREQLYATFQALPAKEKESSGLVMSTWENEPFDGDFEYERSIPKAIGEK